MRNNTQDGVLGWHIGIDGKEKMKKWMSQRGRSISLLIFVCFFNLLQLDVQAQAFESFRGSQVSWARMKFAVLGETKHESQWDWHAHPYGDVAFLDELRNRTTVNMEQNWNVVNIDRLDDMCKFPFIFMHAQRKAAFPVKQVNNLREYLLRGGFLFIEDCVYADYGHDADLFYQSMVRMMPRILPGSKVVRLDHDHEIFSNFYTFKNGMPHMQGNDLGLHAVYYKDRMVAALSPSDLHCGWVTSQWFTVAKREQAFRMGINIYIYAMSH